MTPMRTRSWNQHMDKETKHGEHNPELEFEHQDLSPSGVYAFLTGLAVAGILIYFVLWGLYHYLDSYQRSHQPPQNPLVQPEADTRHVLPQQIQKFPQPRLEKNERVEINDFRLKEEQTLNSYGWVDQKAGVVRIPIGRAMQLIAQQGLPTTPRVGTVPPSEVNVVNQAAQRADVSNLPKKKK
jgi:hypothetical protein